MKIKEQFQLQEHAAQMGRPASYHPGSSPNSSALFGVTVLANADDVLAAIRTAILLGKAFKAEVSVDLFAGKAIRIDSGETLSQTGFLALLASIQGKLRESTISESGNFALEATWTNASFISAGTISISVFGTGSEPKPSALAR